VGHWFSPRLQVYAGAACSFDQLNGLAPTVDDTFNRWHAVPGLRVGLASRVDLLGSTCR